MGAGKDELVQLSAGLPNALFLYLQPLERLNDLLGMADIHLLPQRADAADLVMLSELTGCSPAAVQWSLRPARKPRWEKWCCNAAP
jgi:hypothetical protein